MFSHQLYYKYSTDFAANQLMVNSEIYYYKK